MSKDDLMQEFLDTTSYSGEVKDWRATPTTGEEPDEEEISTSTEAEPIGEKLSAQTFIYLDPKGKPEDHALCRSCRLYSSPEDEICLIHGQNMPIGEDFSCNLYVNGQPDVENADKAEANISPKDSGLESDPVQCQRCKWYFLYEDEPKAGYCKLFALLNDKLSSIFNLAEDVHKNGCCNAWQAK